jgi:hypothetical protein
VAAPESFDERGLDVSTPSEVNKSQPADINGSDDRVYVPLEGDVRIEPQTATVDRYREPRAEGREYR